MINHEGICKGCEKLNNIKNPRKVRQRLKNGAAERKNKTIMEAVKTMIHDQDIPMHLWVEEMSTIVYVHNRLSYSALGFKTR